MPHPNTRLSLAERFWQKVVKTPTCWLWTASIDQNGHGRFQFFKKSLSAQRAAWILTYGELLPGLCVCHQCHTPHCVRPSHMRIGSRSDNGHDGNRRPYGTVRLVDYRKPVIDTATRFWNHVVKTETCWLWDSAQGHNRYGRFGDKGKSFPAHRFAWELMCGPIPDGLYVLHSCDVMACVNPAHLRLGTHLDNMRDRSIRGRTKDMRTPLYSYANPEKAPRGEKNIKAVLTEQQVLAIRAAYKTRGPTFRHSLSYKNIALQYGVTRSTIAFIIQGRSWKHLPL